MTDQELIQHLRTALGFARPFVVAASEGSGRFAMAAGGAVHVMDAAMIAADAHTGNLPPNTQPANKPSVAFGPKRP